MKISWEYPKPGPGITGAFDRFIGPGTTRSELLLELGFAIAFGIAVPLYAIMANTGWNTLQLMVAAIIAFDLAGGIVTNAASSAKRWYHREGQGALQHMSFVAVHLHPLIIAWLFRSMDWSFFFIVYGYLLIAAAVILLLPLYLRRPAALTLFSIGILINIYLLSPTPGLEWFVPFFYLKLLVSHILREEPYRPDNEV